MEEFEIIPASYAAAVEELQNIAKTMEDPEAQIASLSSSAKRAKYLLEYCKEYLRQTEEELNWNYQNK